MKRPLVALVAAAALLLGTCSSPGSSPAPSRAPASPGPASTDAGDGATTVTDALGRRVAFEHAPRRIVLAGKGLFMVADAVYLFPEASSRVVALGQTAQNGRDFISVIDPDYAAKTILEGGAGVEEIAAARPDVVLLKTSNADSLGRPLEALGVQVVYVEFETPEQYLRDLGVLGQLFGDEARAQQLVTFFRDRTDRVTTALAGLGDAERPTVLLLYYTDKNGTVAFNVPPLGYIQSTEARLAGGRLAWEGVQPGPGWTTVTLEQINAWNPDQIYVISYLGNVKDVVSRLTGDPLWQALRAVRQGRIYGFPGDFYSWDQPDPRWVLGLTWLAGKVHPERFGDLDLNREIRSFYRELYGLDDAAYQADIAPLLTGDLP